MATIKCMALVIGTDGERDLMFVKVKCTEEQINEGEHYRAVERHFEAEGMDSIGVFDERDRAGHIADKFAWDSASTIELEAEEDDRDDDWHLGWESHSFGDN